MPKQASSESLIRSSGEIVKAFVALKPGIDPSEALRLELIGFARKRLGSAVAPKEIDFKQDSPKHEAAKSCGGCSRPASWVCPKAISRHWRIRMKPGSTRKPKVAPVDRDHALAPAARNDSYPAS